MSNLSSSLLLLIVALVLLWLAVTGKLGQTIDAWNVLTGKATASTPSTTGATPSATPASGPSNSGTAGGLAFSLPSLPVFGTMGTVGIA